MNHAFLRARRSPARIDLTSDGGATCILANGDSLSIDPATSRATRYWVALGLASRRRAVLVTGGMLDPEGFRQLRLWALWRRLPAVAPRQLA